LDRAAGGYTLIAHSDALDPDTSAAFAVAPAAVELAFLTEPATAEGQVVFDRAIQVAAQQDRFGNAVADAEVALSLAVNPPGDTLRGTTTVTAVGGVATFGDISLALPGDGFVLQASSGTATPVRSAAFSVRVTFTEVSAGKSHNCAVTVAGFAYCWGVNGGWTGDGTTEPRHTTPTPVVGGLTFAQVSAGGAHTCGITTGHVAYCWGSSFDGQLGDGTVFTGSGTPSMVSGGLSFARINAGAEHTCGITTDNVAYCWGLNRDGRLGDGTTDSRTTPTPVAGLLSFVDVSAGGSHTCGVTTANEAYCWGDNYGGQLGDGTAETRLTPTPVAGNAAFTQVTTGFVHTCGITTDNVAYCWGPNTAGQLGDGTTTRRLTPTPVSGALAFADVRAGYDHTCAATTDHAAYCWGFNDSYRLGDGTTIQRETPNPVAGALSFARVGASYLHTCGITTGNVVYCWGFNADGQLGDGTTGDSPTPVRVVQ
jgi:alpha-tubulin suppressor-like RCC1 family protein